MIKWIYNRFFAKFVADDIRYFTWHRQVIQDNFNEVNREIINLKSLEFEIKKEKPKFTKKELEEIAENLADSIKELVEKEVEEQMAIAMSDDILPNTDEIAENVMEDIIRRLTS